MIKKGTLVLVEWEDIQGHGDWNEDPDCPDTASLQSPGYIGKDVDKRFRVLQLCGTYSTDEDTVHDMTSFPTGCITSIREITLGPELWDVGKPDKESNDE